jgi:hypothetical protein
MPLEGNTGVSSKMQCGRGDCGDGKGRCNDCTTYEQNGVAEAES